MSTLGKTSRNLPPPASHTQLKAHRAMEAIWQRRDHGHNLVGTTINIHNGEWTRRGKTGDHFKFGTRNLLSFSLCSFTNVTSPSTHTHMPTTPTHTLYFYTLLLHTSLPLLLLPTPTHSHPHTHTTHSYIQTVG